MLQCIFVFVLQWIIVLQFIIVCVCFTVVSARSLYHCYSVYVSVLQWWVPSPCTTVTVFMCLCYSGECPGPCTTVTVSVLQWWVPGPCTTVRPSVRRRMSSGSWPRWPPNGPRSAIWSSASTPPSRPPAPTARQQQQQHIIITATTTTYNHNNNHNNNNIII